MKTIFITGATSGIGLAIAKKMANSQNQLILCGRRQKKLDEISKKLSAITNVLTLCFDISEKKEVTKLLEMPELQNKLIKIGIERANTVYSKEKYISTWESIFKSLSTKHESAN